MPKKLTPQQLAAIAEGASMEAVLASIPSTDTAAGTQGEATDDEAQAALFAQNEQMVALTAELATLKAEKEVADAALAEKNTALEAALAEQASLKATADAMTETILGRVKNMSIALNLTAPETSEDAAKLVALHADLSAKFNEHFKAGRVSATSKTEETKKKPDWATARLAAAKAIAIY